LLGVRSQPPGPGQILDYLKSLASSSSPPAHEVDKWYFKLDSILNDCTTQRLELVKTAFQNENIIFTQERNWTSAAGVFLNSDEQDVPGAETIRESVRHLSLWRKIGVADRPSVDLAIAWLRQLPSGERLSPADLRRVKAFCALHPFRVWAECKHWHNLSGEWVPVDSLLYSITMQSLIKTAHLHDWVKKRTADFQSLPVTVSSQAPFNGCQQLSCVIEERFIANLQGLDHPEHKQWMQHTGAILMRIILEDESAMNRIRALARDLSETGMLSCPEIEIVPYIGGEPAGIPTRTQCVWKDRVLYTANLSKAKRAHVVPRVIGSHFAHPLIDPIINYCYERSPAQIKAYLEENFPLAPEQTIAPETEDGATGQQAQDLLQDESLEPEQSAPEAAQALFDSEPDMNTDMDDEQEFLFGGQPLTATTREPRRRPPEPPLIHRFASMQGFSQIDGGSFRHPDGRWISKAPDSVFPWALGSPDGDIRRLMPIEHCIELEPLEVEAEVWRLISLFPDSHALILLSTENAPKLVPGAELIAMMESQTLNLFPSRYRLVMQNQNHGPDTITAQPAPSDTITTGF